VKEFMKKWYGAVIISLFSMMMVGNFIVQAASPVVTKETITGQEITTEKESSMEKETSIEETAAKEKPLAGKHLNMAVNATFPPFESVVLDEASGQSSIVGLDIDIANALADRLGFTFEITDMEFNGLVGALQSGRADFVLSGISPTEERKESVDFTEDYFYPKTSIMCKKGENISSLADLPGKTVSASFGTTYEALAKGIEGVSVTSLNSTPLVIQELVNGRVDAAIIDASQAVEFLKVQPSLEFHVLSEEEVPSDDSYAIACPKGSELVAYFNTALKEMKDDGELAAIEEKWMGTGSSDTEESKAGETQTEETKSDDSKILETKEPEKTGFKFDFGRVAKYSNYFTDGILVTLKFTALSVLAGFALGIILALIKVSNLRVLKLIARFYTSVFRGTPLLVQLFLVYFATPQLTGYKIPTLSAAVITFGLNSAAYISEILRGGIQSVDKGQREAAMALGVPYRPMMFNIIIPQAVKTVLPGLVNETIALLKESSLVSTIGVVDMMRGGQMVMNTTYLAFEPFIIVAFIYYVLVMILTSLANLLERRLNRSDNN
jgi:His/Glu/Gln/Arg/opine family amino acid ABC transporter permease subunit